MKASCNSGALRNELAVVVSTGRFLTFPTVQRWPLTVQCSLVLTSRCATQLFGSVTLVPTPDSAESSLASPNISPVKEFALGTRLNDQLYVSRPQGGRSRETGHEARPLVIAAHSAKAPFPTYSPRPISHAGPPRDYGLL